MANRTCSIDGCETAAKSRGWCQKHYMRWYKSGTTELPEKPPQEFCPADDCDRPVRARGWCNTHYMRWLNHGDVAADTPVIDMKPGTPLERLMRRVVVDGNGCWIYGGKLMNTGYGSIHVDGVPTLTHRFSYEVHVGPIPDGLHIDHLCRVRACCNPEHLEPVTQAENNRRAARKLDHCKRGHAFDETNTYVSPDGMRQCRTCRKLRRDSAWSTQ